MGPRPARNRAPPCRYTDSTMCRGERIDGPELDDSDGVESSLRRDASPSLRDPAPQRSSPPGSPFHGFSGGSVPVGPDVLHGKPRLSLFPPRRLGWITAGPRPPCPAFPQVCSGGSHIHTGRSRVGGRRKYAQVVQYPVLAAQPNADLAHGEDEFNQLNMHHVFFITVIAFNFAVSTIIFYFYDFTTVFNSINSLGYYCVDIICASYFAHP